MYRFGMRIAGMDFGVACLYESTGAYFQCYQVKESHTLYCAEVSREDLEAEQRALDEEADREGLRRRVFSGPFLERAVIQRKVAVFALSRGILLLHGSTVAVDGRAYLFTAKTGVGKSTHTRLWREVFGARAVMINDDRAFLEAGEDGYVAYGSPWSGKHGLDANISAPLAGICVLERSPENWIVPMEQGEAAERLMEQGFVPRPGDEKAVEALVKKLAEEVPVWKMGCNREREAVDVAFAGMV